MFASAISNKSSKVVKLIYAMQDCQIDKSFLARIFRSKVSPFWFGITYQVTNSTISIETFRNTAFANIIFVHQTETRKISSFAPAERAFKPQSCR